MVDILRKNSPDGRPEAVGNSPFDILLLQEAGLLLLTPLNCDILLLSIQTIFDTHLRIIIVPYPRVFSSLILPPIKEGPSFQFVKMFEALSEANLM